MPRYFHVLGRRCVVATEPKRKLARVSGAYGFTGFQVGRTVFAVGRA